jgi:hypothetical protein
MSLPVWSVRIAWKRYPSRSVSVSCAPGVRALTPDEHPRPGRPCGEVEVCGDLCDLSVVSRAAVLVDRRDPGVVGDLGDRGAHRLGQVNADRERADRAPSTPGAPRSGGNPVPQRPDRRTLRAGRDGGDPCRRMRSFIRNGYPADGARRDSAQSGSVPRSQVDSMPLSALAARRRYEA